nr:peroxisomal (S)-2-hydroxy-acid oxidase GLO4-like [Ipomoea batatas]
MAGEPVNVKEFQELARQALPKMYYDFYAGGAEDEHTLKDNEKAFQRIIIDMSTTILGYKTSAPIMVGPTARHKLANPDGEVATARAAAACNVIMGMSFSASCTIEEVASSCNAVRFFQIYVFKRRDITELMVRRAVKNGFKAIILTVDTPRLGRREADIKNKLISPPLKNFEGLISTAVVPESGSGLEAYASSTLGSSLSWKVVLAVKGKVPVLFDGGVRRGTDIFKALALGAQAVLIGRPVVFGLAAKGQNGVRQVIEMLKNELELTMALSGCCTIKDITRSHVRTENESLACRL